MVYYLLSSNPKLSKLPHISHIFNVIFCILIGFTGFVRFLKLRYHTLVPDTYDRVAAAVSALEIHSHGMLLLVVRY